MVFLLNHKSSIKLLKKFEFSRIRPFKIKSWKADTFYYVAKKNSSLFFFKLSKNPEKIKREFKSYTFVEKILEKQYLVGLIDFKTSLKLSYIQYNFIQNATFLSQNNFRIFHEKILRILISLNKGGLIHRDIRPQNFLIEGSNIKIIDFEFITCLKFDKNLEFDLNNKENLLMLMNCGSEFKKGYYTWNDFYSFQQIAIKYGCQDLVDEKKIFPYLRNSNYTLLR